MKEVKVDITVKNQKSVYVAADGEQFSDHDICVDYEIAKTKVTNYNYQKLVKGVVSECELFDCECDDYGYDVVTINSKEDIQTVAEQALWQSSCHQHSKEDYAKKLKVGETYFIGTGYCNDDFYYPVTKQDIIDKLTSRLDKSLEKICQKKEEKQ